MYNYYLKYMINNKFDGFYQGLLPDVRIEKRAEKMMHDMNNFGKVVVNKFCFTNTEKIGAYRMLGNNNFSHLDLSEGVYKSCKENQVCDHLLCIQDTTELNFTHHLERIGKEDKDIGPVIRDDNAGFFCHPMLVVDPEYGIPIGLSSIHIWNRSWDKKNKYQRNYQYQDISQKESYRWIDSAQRTKKLLSETTVLTIIGDREADIYEEIALVPDERTHLLIRSSWNRNLYGSKENLFEALASSEEKATYDLSLKGNKHRKKRVAKMSLRFIKVQIQKPTKKKLDNYPNYVQMWAIQAMELKESTPRGEEPILWRLLTTHNINCVQDAEKCVEWYKDRWLIEELFRVLKSKGLEIESSQLETGAALKKLVVMALQVGLNTMVLKLSLKIPNELKASISFTKTQRQFIALLMNTLEGKTDKQKNPYAKQTLAWAAWGIARLSGWSGYKSHGPPGYISIKTGLDIFQNKYEGFKLALDILNNKDVYKD
jgi:hypothetical protein